MPERAPPSLRRAAGATGIVVTVVASLGLRDPLASMASYTAALMALNQIAPPLLLLALDRPGPRAARFLAATLDPILAFTAFCTLSVAVSLPASSNRRWPTRCTRPRSGCSNSGPAS